MGDNNKEKSIQPSVKIPDIEYCLYARKSSESDERQAMSIESQVQEMSAIAVRSNLFVKEIKRHQEVAKSDYAVIVTHAFKEGKSRFFIEENVIVIDPLGLLDIAILLRDSIIDIHKMKLTKDEAKEKGMQILRYMQSGDFRNNMIDTIEKSRKAYELLIKEVKNHQGEWIERIKIYSAIHNNIQNVRQSIGEIVTGGPVQLEPYEFVQLDSRELPKLKSGTENT